MLHLCVIYSFHYNAKWRTRFKKSFEYFKNVKKRIRGGLPNKSVLKLTRYIIKICKKDKIIKCKR